MPASSSAVVVAPPSVLTRLARDAVRYRWALLVGVALLVSLRAIGHGHGDWDFFVDASRRLVGEDVSGLPKAGGLHLYASYPDVVTGPLSLMLVRASAAAGGAGSYAIAVVAANLIVVGALAMIERTAVVLDRARPETMLIGGVVALVSWSELAGFGHLDDALALVAVVAAFFGIGARRWLVVGLALGFAIASKQWGVMFLPLVFALPARRWRALLVAAGAGALAWAPFVLAAPKMLSQRGLTQIVANDSVFGVLNYPKLQGPSWVRSVQIAGGLLVVGLAVWRGRWPAAILAAVALRVLLDPATWSYYTAAVVLGAFAWDVLGTRRMLPLWTVAEFLLLAEATTLIDDAQLRGVLRIAACLLALAPLMGSRRPVVTITAPVGVPADVAAVTR